MKPIEQIGALMPSSIIQGAVWGKHLASNPKSKQGMKRLGKMYLKTGSKILNKFKKWYMNMYRFRIKYLYILISDSTTSSALRESIAVV